MMFVLVMVVTVLVAVGLVGYAWGSYDERKSWEKNWTVRRKEDE